MVAGVAVGVLGVGDGGKVGGTRERFPAGLLVEDLLSARDM